jgi:metal-sulfur cluster biosynthetic enzyme
MMAQDVQVELKQSVLRALSTVTDPELDEPITDLGFVKELSVSDEGRVSLDLVTSTFWCSPNFVYMMLEEARDVVSKIDGISEVRVHLEGHHDSDRINDGINSRKSFSECYPTEAGGNLEELTRMIRTRVLRSRLSSMVAAMSRAGVIPFELLGVSRRDVVADDETLVVTLGDKSLRVSDPVDAKRIARYLSFLDGLGRANGPLMIFDLEGRTPEPHELESMLALSRSAKSNFSLNAELCRALLESRLNREEPSPSESRT